MKMHRIVWAIWASIPVAALAYHYGPGQASYQQDVAVSVQERANKLEENAIKLQAKAHEAHLAALAARQQAESDPTTENEALAIVAASKESDAFQLSSAAWNAVADAYTEILATTELADLQTRCALRWSRSRARVRAGDMWTGITELEDILNELDESDPSQSEMAVVTREELGTAYYYAARLMRLSGDAPEEWMIESGKARQQFRYLAEHSAKSSGSVNKVKDYQRDVEHVLNLEQSALIDIQGKPLPKDSPLGRTGNRPCNGKGKSKRPPERQDGRGAGGAGAVRSGW